MTKQGSLEELQKRTLLLCFIAYMLLYTGRLNLSIASPLLQNSGLLNKEQIGVLGSAFFFVYAAGRIINGNIGDRIAPKPFLAFGMFASALCNLAIALLPPVWCMYVLWGCNGLFQSMLWGAALRNVSLTYPLKAKAEQAAMVLSASVGVGNLLAIVLASSMAQISLRMIFFVPGLLMLTMSLLLLLFLPDNRATHSTEVRTSFSCLRNPNLLKMLLPAAMHGVVKENLTLWTPLLLMDLYQLDFSNVKYYIFLMPLATLLGRMLFPVWYKLCNSNETITLVSAFLLCIAMLFPFLLFTPPIWLTGILLAVVCICTSVINAELMSVYPINFQKSNQVSTVSGILDCATYIGSALGSATFGFLIISSGYTAMISVWIALCGLSVGILYPVKYARLKSA
jgi:OPA family glycerol-3-phosphate transporter-like MFS transporter